MAPQLASARAAAARDKLRGSLSRYYRLENFDLFFAPSLHISRVLLSQLFLRQEQSRNHTRYASHYPVSELSVLPTLPMTAGNIALVDHVDMQQGRVRALSECQSHGVTDASESFATQLHKRLVSDARLFVARLDRHAALCGDLVLIALRTADFSTLVRSELRLFEQGLALGGAPEQALAMMKDNEWRPYNIAMVEKIALDSPFILHSIQQPGLPFALFPLPKGLNASELPQDIQVLPEQAQLRLRADVRGGVNKQLNVTPALKKRLKDLLMLSRDS
ncbi:DUF6024 family protein [Pantoea sp. DY-15]|uniref:DUF6024 family protein n=1 Tax=Pantoea sp. DY-15 TaxID=2871489 RepID=UPI001C9871B8|nr:DUF6024 family protein [Pantoea sp. DY-15]MBY4886513.1 DUF6024 family protein [Pantoea sp. DY-15]